MSIQGLIDAFGITLHHYRPINTVASDGTIVRSWGKNFQVTGFVQPSSQNDPFVNYRQEGTRSATIYLSGLIDCNIEGEFRDSTSAPARRWKIIGSVNPAELGVSGRSSHLNMTVVNVVEVVEFDTEVTP